MSKRIIGSVLLIIFSLIGLCGKVLGEERYHIGVRVVNINDSPVQKARVSTTFGYVDENTHTDESKGITDEEGKVMLVSFEGSCRVHVEHDDYITFASDKFEVYRGKYLKVVIVKPDDFGAGKKPSMSEYDEEEAQRIFGDKTELNKKEDKEESQDESSTRKDNDYARLYVDKSSTVKGGHDNSSWSSVKRVYLDGEDIGEPPIATNINPGRHIIKVELSTDEGTKIITYEINAEGGRWYRPNF